MPGWAIIRGVVPRCGHVAVCTINGWHRKTSPARPVACTTVRHMTDGRTRAHVGPVLAVDLVAALDMPAHVARVLLGREPHRHRAADASAACPADGTDQRVVCGPQRGRSTGGRKRTTLRAGDPHNGTSPRRPVTAHTLPGKCFPDGFLARGGDVRIDGTAHGDVPVPLKLLDLAAVHGTSRPNAPAPGIQYPGALTCRIRRMHARAPFLSKMSSITRLGQLCPWISRQNAAMAGRILYLLGGAPRVGKSTLAQRLLAAEGIPWLPSDVVRTVLRRVLPELEAVDQDPVDVARLAELMYPHIEQAAEVCVEEAEQFLIEGFELAPTYPARLKAALPATSVRACFLGHRRRPCQLPRPKASTRGAGIAHGS